MTWSCPRVCARYAPSGSSDSSVFGQAHARTEAGARATEPHDSVGAGPPRRAAPAVHRQRCGQRGPGAPPFPISRPTTHRPTVCIALIPVLWLCFMIVRGLSHSRLRVVLLTCPCLMLRRQSKGDFRMPQHTQPTAAPRTTSAGAGALARVGRARWAAAERGNVHAVDAGRGTRDGSPTTEAMDD